MTKEEVIKGIIDLDKEFGTSDLLRHLGGKLLTLDDRRIVIETLDSLYEEGKLSHYFDEQKLIYLPNQRALKLKIKSL